MKAYRLDNNFRYSPRVSYTYGFSAGDVVYADLSDELDLDGEISVYASADLSVLTPDGSRRGYARPAALLPLESDVVQLSAVRAALVALGIEADVVAVAQAIEAAAKGA